MNATSTVVIAGGFCFIFVGITAADSWALKTPQEPKKIILSAESEGQAELDYSLPAVVESELVDSLSKYLIAGGDIHEQPLYTKQSTATKLEVLKQLGESLAVQKAYSSLQALAESVTEEERLQSGIQFRYAQTLAKTDVKQAIAAYHALTAHTPNHQAATINLGLLLNRQKQYEQAANSLRHAVKISSGSRKAKALSALGSSYIGLDDLVKAERYFDRSIQYRPKHAATWLKLATVREQLNHEFDAVAKTYQRALALKPDYLRGLRAYGGFLLQQGEFETAVQPLEQALKMSRNDERIHLSLAWAYTELGRMNAAQSQWQWLKHKSDKQSLRLLAAHFDNALNRKSEPLKALPSGHEFMYAKAVIAQMNHQQLLASKLLKQIPEHTSVTKRANQRLLKLLATG